MPRNNNIVVACDDNHEEHKTTLHAYERQGAHEAQDAQGGQPTDIPTPQEAVEMMHPAILAKIRDRLLNHANYGQDDFEDLYSELKFVVLLARNCFKPGTISEKTGQPLTFVGYCTSALDRHICKMFERRIKRNDDTPHISLDEPPKEEGAVSNADKAALDESRIQHVDPVFEAWLNDHDMRCAIATLKGRLRIEAEILLLEDGSVEQAAKAAGVNPSTVYHIDLDKLFTGVSRVLHEHDN